MTTEEIVNLVKISVADLQVDAAQGADQPELVVPREQILAVVRALREHPALRFMHLSDLTAVDWWPGEPRFQVVYHLVSIEQRLRLRLKVPLQGEDAHLPTLTVFWSGADWPEREVFDMFGIVFDGHPDLRRVLMPEDWEGHPLRKDHPVQISMPVKVYEPLQISTEDFQRNIEKDRAARERGK
jgi:NADH-quinone oxidoreductase subunit C